MGIEYKYHYDPVDDLIPRCLTEEQREYFSQYGRLLDEIVNFGTQVLTWEITHLEKEEYLSVPLMLVRNALELTDSCSILIKKGSIEAAKILTRSLFETTLYLLYLCDKDFKKRCYAYMTASVLDYIKFQKKVLKGFSEVTSSQHRPLSQDQISEIENVILDKESLFQKAEYSDAYQYYKNESKRRNIAKRKPLNGWYSYYNGPENLRELSINLRLEDHYNYFYSQYSKLAHGNEAILGKMVLSEEEENADIYQLRLWLGIEDVFMYAFSFSSSLLLKYASTLYPEKSDQIREFINWKNKILVKASK